MRTAILLGRVAAWRLFSFILVCFLALIEVQGAEPQYQGKPASYWIKAYTVGMTEEELIKAGGVQKWDAESLRKEKETREKASRALKGMGPAAVPYIVSWIKSADELAYRGRTQKGNPPGEAEKPLPSWVSANDVEWRSLEVLKVFGAGAYEAMPVMMEHLNNSNVFTAVMACEALGSLRAKGEPAMAILAFKLSDKDPVIRAMAASAIGGILPFCPERGRHQSVLQELVRALKDDARSVRWNVASAIGNFAADGKDAVPALIESLKAGNDSAASALGVIGPAAKAAVPLLTELAEGNDIYLKDVAATALKRIEREAPKGGQPKIYDEKADGSKQIADALVIAKKENKHVLLQFGGNWCGWCIRLHKLFETDQGIGGKLKSDYVVVLIDVTNEHNKDVDAKYGNPTQFGAPVIVVLDADGKQLTTQDASKMVSGENFDPEKVKAFLKEWAPKR